MTLEMSIRANTEMCQEDVALIHLPPSLKYFAGNKEQSTVRVLGRHIALL